MKKKLSRTTRLGLTILMLLALAPATTATAAGLDSQAEQLL